VIAESCHLLRRIPDGPGRLPRLIDRGAVELDFSLAREHTSIADLLHRYRHRRASLADACLVGMSELHDPSIVLTLDSDFYVYRRLGRRTIPLLHPSQP